MSGHGMASCATGAQSDNLRGQATRAPPGAQSDNLRGQAARAPPGAQSDNLRGQAARAPQAHNLIICVAKPRVSHPAHGISSQLTERANIQSATCLTTKAGCMRTVMLGSMACLADAKASEVACMAHIRRKFVDVQQSQGSVIAEEAIKRIAKLYGIEKQARGCCP